MCLGNVWKDFSADNIKKAGLNGYVYDFIVDFEAIPVISIPYIHKYLMIKNELFGFVKQIFVSAMMFLVVIYQA